jgi:hypothetical protein
MTTQLSTEALAVISKVEKLLALAGNNTNEAEAQAASEKAMELLAAYNLSMAMVGDSTKTATRADKKLNGGLYGWQRDLWNAVAKLNFCEYRFIRGLTKGSSYQHRLVGREENVVSARVMAEYLQQAVERLAQEWSRDLGYRSVFVREAIAYREGMASRLSSRLWDLRYQRIREDRRKQEEQAANATGQNALVLADVIHAEEDLNADYMEGLEPGTHARWRAERNARRAKAQAEAAALLAKRDEEEAANPALREARLAQEEADRIQRQKENEEWSRKYEKKQARRAKTPAEKRQELNGYWEGYEDGADIGLDKQVDEKKGKTLRIAG